MKLDEGGIVFGARVLQKHLIAFEKELSGVQAGSTDIEFVHRTRVASRRLRATLPLFADCLPRKQSAGWMKEIRAVTRALGEARDADVQFERLEEYRRATREPSAQPGLNRLRLRLRQQRAALQPGLLKAVERLKSSNLLGEMNAALSPFVARLEGVSFYTPPLYAHACTNITARLEELLEYDVVVNDESNMLGLHEMRIAAKRLRYTLEAFAPLYSGELKEWLQVTRKVQDDLGEIHDSDIWQEFSPRFLAEEEQRMRAYLGHAGPFPRLVPGVEGYAAARQAERQKTYARFRTAWAKWQAAALWDGLRATLQAPPLNA